MKFRTIGVLTAAALGIAPVPASAEQAQSVTLDVPGITCAGCEARIRGAVGGISGVRAVEASAPGKVAVVTFDPDTAKVEQFIRAIQEVGYLSTVAEGSYRCPQCGTTYPRAGECILCEIALEPA